jgi:hypothetical protein
MKINIRSRLLSISSILYFKFVSIDEMQIITDVDIKKLKRLAGDFKL